MKSNPDQTAYILAAASDDPAPGPPPEFAPEPRVECELKLIMDGSVHLQERSFGRNDKGWYDSADLFDDCIDDVELEMSFNDGAIQLRLIKYHIENEESGRAFHVSATARFGPDRVKLLRRFLEFLIAVDADAS
jgi:hypothetical protein